MWSFLNQRRESMKKIFVRLSLLVVVILVASNSIADSIKNRLGITGRVGLIVPSDSREIATGTVGTNTDFIGGGGLMYGITENIAAEMDITHADFGSNSNLDFDITNISLGVQYRFTDLPNKRFVPYAGGGLDILLNGVSDGSVDDVVGVHASAGFDYFFLRQLACNVEAKGILAPDADFRSPGGAKLGDFDPTNFSMTFGVRYFFN
jgi:outer membrane protein